MWWFGSPKLRSATIIPMGVVAVGSNRSKLEVLSSLYEIGVGRVDWEGSITYHALILSHLSSCSTSAWVDSVNKSPFR